MTPDEQEALSIRYGLRQTVAKLKSGRYALFDHTAAAPDLRITFIGTWEELLPFVTVYIPPEPRFSVSSPGLPSKLASLNLDLDL